jgi:hypothetical protein
LQISQSDVDERRYAIHDPGSTRQLERLLVALANLCWLHALLQAVIPGQEGPVYASHELVFHGPYDTGRARLGLTV